MYKYWVRLDHPAWSDLPEAARQEVEAQRTLWNQLVDAFEQRSKGSFFTEARRVAASSPATWASREFLLNQFQSATRRFFKKQAGPPKRKHGIPQEVHFYHRFTDGGLPVLRIFGRSRRLHLEPLSPDAWNPALPQRQRRRQTRTYGSFRVGETTLPFQTLLHRPLPEGAYLKAAALVGKQVVQSGYRRCHNGSRLIPARWVWSLQLTLEVPPCPLPVPASGRPTAALGLSYRVEAEDQLRLGVLTDSSSREEAFFLPPQILQAWEYKRALQRQMDCVLEETKARLREIPRPHPLPALAHNLLSHLGNVRAPGMWRLLHLLEEAAVTGEVVEIIRHWADRSTRLLRETRGLERRYLAHRDWFYHTVARRLCQRYRQLVVEEVEAPTLTSGEREGHTLHAREVAAYRQLAPLSRFVMLLRQAATKTGTEIMERSAFANSTRVRPGLAGGDQGARASRTP